jgi:hypothetical protein
VRPKHAKQSELCNYNCGGVDDRNDKNRNSSTNRRYKHLSGHYTGSLCKDRTGVRIRVKRTMPQAFSSLLPTAAAGVQFPVNRARFS